MKTEEKKQLTLFGLPWYQAIIAVVLCALPMYMEIQSDSMTGTLCSCFALAVVLKEIGDRLPIWNDYIGGGLLMVFFGVAILKQFGLIPQETVDSINWLISDDVNLLELYIIALIVGSVLALDHDILLRSFAGYIPAILGGLAVAALFGIVGGLAFGVAPADAVIKYVLPIMGGGNGAGAVPLSQIYEQVTGDAAANYYTFAIIILTIANIFAIISCALLNTLGKKFPVLTGDGKTLVRKGGNVARNDAKVESNSKDMAAGMLIMFAAFSVGRIMSKRILPTIFGAAIHAYAYVIIFAVILSASGLIPASVRAGAKRIQGFMTGVLSTIIMVGMGTDFNIAELISALSFSNVIMALLIVVGAVIGAGGVGYLVGFYPVDSAITAGMCMANRGGTGDIACLGAADRMELIAYAQLSSRLGGGIVLIIASFVFSFLM